MRNVEPLESEQYQSLEILIEPFIELPFDDLPEEIKSHWNREETVYFWDSFTPTGRREIAQRHDIHNDPALIAEQQYYFDLTGKKHSLKDEIRKWELVGIVTATDRQIQADNIKRLNAELAEVKRLLNSVPEQAGTQSQAASEQPADTVPAPAMLQDPERRLVALRSLGGDARWKRGLNSVQTWQFTGIKKLVAQEKANKRKRSDEKTIREDLREAALAESIKKGNTRCT